MEKFQFDEDFDFFLEEFSLPHDCQPINESVITTYHNRLPEQLFDYWRQLGWCGYGQGLLWMTNPAEYQPVLDNWLTGTLFEDRDDLSVIARTAFGELYVWAKGKGEVLSIRPITGVINYYPEDDNKSYSTEEENKYMRYFWGNKDPKYVDYNDQNDTPLFDRALKKLGPVKADEMYGLKLARALGGDILLDNLGIMKLAVYHDIARQMKAPEIIVIDTSDQ